MAKIVKSFSSEETWAWKDGKFVDGKTVCCVNHQFRKDDRSFVHGSIEPGEDHGWTSATSDYYYLILKGSGVVCISDDDSFTCNKNIEVSAGESFKIAAGTTYNYSAGEDGLEFALFMNNLWEE